MAVILDRSRPYGTVTPTLDGAFFDQDGWFYDRDFRRLRPSDPTVAAAQQATPAKTAVDAIYDLPPWRRTSPKTKVVPKDSNQRKRKYPRSTEQRIAPQVMAKASATPPPPSVNLSAWAAGEERYLFSQVKQEIRNRFSVIVNQEGDALGVLVREKVISPNEIPGYQQSSEPQSAGEPQPEAPPRPRRGNSAALAKARAVAAANRAARKAAAELPPTPQE